MESNTHQKYRGSIYYEMTNKGRRSVKYVRGAKPVYCYRWVAEITVHYKRYRCRSQSYDKVRAWLNDMLAKLESCDSAEEFEKAYPKIAGQGKFRMKTPKRKPTDEND